MAMAVEQDVAGELRGLIAGDALLEELAEEKSLTAEFDSAGIVGEELLEFVGED